MRLRYGWLTAVLIAVLLVAACSPKQASPTRTRQVADEDAPVATATEIPATEAAKPSATPAVEQEEPASEPEESSQRLGSEDDWHVLGSPDAPVTIIEYSDFQ